jgi:hypothetical protein
MVWKVQSAGHCAQCVVLLPQSFDFLEPKTMNRALASSKRRWPTAKARN